VEKKVPHADLKLSWSWDRVGMEDLEFGFGERESTVREIYLVHQSTGVKHRLDRSGPS